jgi:hypothetical protein
MQRFHPSVSWLSLARCKYLGFIEYQPFHSAASFGFTIVLLDSQALPLQFGVFFSIVRSATQGARHKLKRGPKGRATSDIGAYRRALCGTCDALEAANATGHRRES